MTICSVCHKIIVFSLKYTFILRLQRPRIDMGDLFLVFYN